MTTVTPQTEETGPTAPEVVEPQQQATDRPEGLPENFKSVEDLAKAFKETQAELTRTKQGNAPQEQQEQQEEQQAEQETQETEQDLSAEDEAALEAAKKAGVDLTEYSNEFWEQGDLTEERRGEVAEKLKSVFGDEAQSIVNEFVEGKKLILKNQQTMLYNEAGGETQYKAMVNWAAQNLTQQEIAAYDKAVEGDIHQAQLAIGGLRAKYERAVGRDPNLVTGENSVAGSSAGYKSKAEMMEDMSNPKYKKDPAFRERVQKKIANSSVMG
jgi:hypothetical protein